MITCFIPVDEGRYFEEAVIVTSELDGRRFEERKIVKYEARQHRGRFVIDLPRKYFVTLLAGPQGLKWERENPEVMEWLGKGLPDYNGTIFPGEHRPPPIPITYKAPEMVRMLAPEDVTQFSHGGVQYPVENGHVTVTDVVADVLRAHGFRDAA